MKCIANSLLLTWLSMLTNTSDGPLLKAGLACGVNESRCPGLEGTSPVEALGAVAGECFHDMELMIVENSQIFRCFVRASPLPTQ